MVGLLAGLSISVFILNLFYISWIYRGLRKIKKFTPVQNAAIRKFSIIIAAHNEAENINKCLSNLALQNYPKEKYEIVVIADRCTDGTVQAAEQFKNRFPQLKIFEVIDIPAGLSPKKYALNKGIQEASHDHFLFLDADVLPTQNHLQTMSAYFTDDTDAVVGIMKLTPGNTMWHRLLVYERLMNWSVAAGSSGHHKPIIAYGGNWGYTRQAFAKVGGFEKIFHSLGGDDDLLIQQFGKANLTIKFCVNPEGWVTTEAPGSLKKFLQQRKRHFSAAKYYQNEFKAGYFFYHASNLLLWVMPFFYPPAFFLLALKILYTAGLMKFSKEVFRESVNLAAIPAFEFLFMLYNTLIGPLSFFGRVKW